MSYRAVLDGDGFHNPEGVVTLDGVSFDDGTTLAPDLSEVADLQVTSSDVTWVIEADLAFDVAAATGEETVDGYVVTVSYDGALTDATAASHVLYQDDVDTPRFDLDASAAMDAEETSLEDGVIVFEVDGDTAAHADLFAVIDEGTIMAAGVAYGAAEAEIVRDDADLVLDTTTMLVGIG